MARIPINIATGSLQKDEIIVGIDLGTTNSLIAIIHPDTRKSLVLKEEDQTTLVPSIIYFGKAGNVVVGDEAKAHLVDEPSQTIYSVKRLMGKSFKDVEESKKLPYEIIESQLEDELVKIKVGDKFYNPVELSSYILKTLKSRAEHILKTPVNKAVITVPAYFNDAQRQATRNAGRLAGLDVLRIINEPTAASLAYGIGLNREEHKIIAVYDLGGGTFDISILRLHEGVFDVLSTHGDTTLGGDDFDATVVNYWTEENPGLQSLVSSNQTIKQKLRLFAEKAKKHLTTNISFSENLDGFHLSLTKEKFATIIQPLIQRTIASCRAAIKDAELDIDEIDEVIMVGGSTRVTEVKDAVSNFFNKNVNDTIDPDEVVALGAAIQSDILAGNNKDMLLLDITPLSLGIEMQGKLMDVLIPRNSKIPTNAARQYTTQVDGQSGMKIAVYQGERDIVTDNRKLAEFNLEGIPAMPAGLPKVEVKFMINADGILKVNATELRSRVEQTIEVVPQSGITDDDVEKMLMDSIGHAKDDIQTRALVEAQTEGEQLLKTTEKFISKNNSLLSGDEISATAAAMQALQLALTMDDKNLIQAKTEELNSISQGYAERVMNQAIANSLKGKHLS